MHCPTLPPFELSYGLDRHRKVEPNVFVIAPRGKRVLVYFTSSGDGDACYVYGVKQRNAVSGGRRVLACFSHILCSGTLIYGMEVPCGSDGTRIVCEDLLWFQGRRVDRESIQNKIPMWSALFSRELGTPPSSRYLELGLPVWTESKSDAMQVAHKSSYPTRGVLGYVSHARGMHPVQLLNVTSRNNTPTERDGALVMEVKAHIEPDTYSLFCQDDRGSRVCIGKAVVSSIETSVMLNRIFRNIRENDNLDLLEESEDDEEFEDIREDRFVDLDRCVRMICRRHERLNAWQPIGKADENAVLANQRSVSQISKSAPARFSGPSTHGSKVKQQTRWKPGESSARKFHRSR